MDGAEFYCDPRRYKSVPPRLFHNLGHGKFEDVTEKSGLAKAPGKGMGISIADFNDDGWPDVFIANVPWLFRWFTPLFGGGPLARELHPWFGLFFVFFFGLQMLNWIRPMAWTKGDTNWMRNIKRVVSGEETLESPDTGFFNAGQKAMFWEIVVEACST